MTDPHPPSEALAYATLSELKEKLSSGEVTSLELVNVFLERIEALDVAGTEVSLRSIAQVHQDAREEAQRCDDERRRGESRGPLHGIPVIIKDNIEAIGLGGLAGSSALVGRPTRDADVVISLKNAGAILLASTNLSQWANIRSARSTSGWSATGGLVGNPWALDRSAGGSSSGSGAALAAGLAPIALGTETDGSIVCPASVNGVVGLKPTVGRLSTKHIIPISASQDTPGPMARNVDDVAALYAALVGASVNSTLSSLTFAAGTNWLTGNPETDALYVALVEQLRAKGLAVYDRELAVPGAQDGEDEGTVLFSELHDDLSAYLAERPGDGVKSLKDVVDYEDLYKETEQPFFGHDLFELALATGGRSGAAYKEARERNLRWAVETCLTPALAGVDVLLAPSYGPSWKSDLAVGGHPGPASPATMAPAIAGWPIMNIPMGLVQGLPVGLALIARANDEEKLLSAARIIEGIVNEISPLPRPFWQRPTRG